VVNQVALNGNAGKVMLNSYWRVYHRYQFSAPVAESEAIAF